ncbi:hypothetical protein SLEP1_g2148 [Rubroshorea leprosula]|uniref:Uncharacterized protein n=1 Tax=Rubroshorea leprosula TaxID=152421 RepID=A0AAV5HPX6_9ROSI|nr:hypothetical protein SLEP1_g2148 [Rubroshorea leprosula]
MNSLQVQLNVSLNERSHFLASDLGIIYLSHCYNTEVLGCQISWDCSVFLSTSSFSHIQYDKHTPSLEVGNTSFK